MLSNVCNRFFFSIHEQIGCVLIMQLQGYIFITTHKETVLEILAIQLNGKAIVF